MTAFLHNKTYIPVITATLAITVAAMLSFDWMSDIQYMLLIAGSVFIGIPHGAADNHIFFRSNIYPAKYRKLLFYLTYLFIAGIYGVFWIFFPAASLILFLFISVYHFGQSNLFYLSVNKNVFLRFFLSVLWGSYALGLPLLFHANEALPVIEKILGYKVMSISQVDTVLWPLVIALFMGNVVMLVVLKMSGYLRIRHFVKEMLNLLILGGLSYFAPLFIAFLTYWIFWHSLNSVIEISNFLFGRNRLHKLKLFYKKSWPLSVISVTGIAVVLLLSSHSNSLEGMLSLYFILIAVITLPHVIMMDWLYTSRINAS